MDREAFPGPSPNPLTIVVRQRLPEMRIFPSKQGADSSLIGAVTVMGRFFGSFEHESEAKPGIAVLMRG